jgi:hypothetical protein
MTSRDRELVGWVARLGAAGVADVNVRFGLGRTVGYRRVAACIEAGLLERVRLLYGSPALVIATRHGLRWAGLERLGPCRLGVASFVHWAACARLAALLESRGAVLWSERELRHHERDAGELLASIEISQRGERRVHRPDLVLVDRDGGLPVAIEVELTVKGSHRLDAICRGYARARHLAGARYFAAPEPGRAVGRAIHRTSAHDVIDVRPLPWNDNQSRRDP